MKLDQFFKMKMGMGAFAIALLMSGCLDKENLYNPDQGKNQLPPKDEMFDYTTRTEVKLSIDYGMPYFQAIIQLYDEYPLNEDEKSLKEGIVPIFSAYTDSDSKYSGTMNIPTATKELYLYTSKWGLPRCIKLELKDNTATYNGKTEARSSLVASRAVAPNNNFSGTQAPYKYTEGTNIFYSLYSWGGYFDLAAPANCLTEYTDNATLSAVSRRAAAYFSENKGNAFVEAAGGKTNLITTEAGTAVDVVLLFEKGQYRNTFGYFYYPKGQKPTDMSQVKKYIIFPDASLDINSYLGTKAGKTIRLKYFGTSGTDSGVDEFPAGYEIAWFYIRAGAGENDGYMSYGSGGSYGSLNIFALLNKTSICTSNAEGSDKRFVMMKDAKTGILVLGFEDSATVSENDDYCDVAFFLRTSKKVEDPGVEIPDGDNKPEPGTQTIQGVLCFEDQWPKAGDYDLNDVAVRYKREFTFGTDNKYTGAKETFTFIQHDGAATYDNFFAYKLVNPGTKISTSSDVLYETTTNSYVINKSAKQSRNVEFTVERTFSSVMDRKTIEDDFNPYIIIGSYTEGTRTEVHLPVKDGTEYMDKAKVATEDDAYFTNIKTKRPFAIDVADPKFALSPEKVAIEVTYPKFVDWINSGSNRENSDWYKK